jgi:hypothetical protein
VHAHIRVSDDGLIEMARLAPGPSSESLQGRNPREIGRGSDALLWGFWRAGRSTRRSRRDDRDDIRDRDGCENGDRKRIRRGSRCCKATGSSKLAGDKTNSFYSGRCTSRHALCFSAETRRYHDVSIRITSRLGEAR